MQPFGQRVVAVVAHRRHGCGERARIARLDQTVGVDAEDFRQAADIRGDQREFCARPLKRDVGQRLRARRQHQNLSRQKRLARRHRAGKMHLMHEAEAGDLVFKRGAVGPVAVEIGAAAPAVFCENRKRLDQHVRALQRTQFADIDEIDRIRLRFDRLQLIGPDAVVNHAGEGGCTNLLLENIQRVFALEQEQPGSFLHEAFAGEVEQAHGRECGVVQAAAVRGVDLERGTAGKAHIGAALGAVAVQHIRIGAGGTRVHMRDRRAVAVADVPAHRHPRHAQRQGLLECCELPVGRVAAGAGIRDDTDRMAALCLLGRQISDVPEQSSDRRAENVQDAEGLRHPLQNQRSSMVIVSPGRIG